MSIVELSPILIPYFLGFFIFRGFYAIFPIYIQLKINLTETEVVSIWSLVSGVGLLAGAITRIPAGIISDYIGRFKSIIIAFLLYIIAITILFLKPTVLFFIIGIALIRMTLNIYAMTGRAIVSISKRDKGFKNGLLSAMVGLGSFAGPIIFSYSLDNFKIDTIYIIAYIFISIDTLLFFIALELMPLLHKRISKKTSIIDLDLSPVPNRLNNMSFKGLKVKGVKQSIALFFIAGIIYGFITSVYAIYGYNILNLDASLIGLIIGGSSLIQIIWAPIVGKLYMKFKDENVREYAWITVFIATIIIYFGKIHYVFYILGFYLLVLGNSSFFTMEITRLGRIVDKNDFSITFGTATTLLILGSAFSSYISPIFYNIIPEGTFLIAAIISFLTLVTLEINKII